MGRGLGNRGSASSRNAVSGNKRQLSLPWRKQVIFWICCVFLHFKAGQGTGMGQSLEHWLGTLGTEHPLDPPLDCSPHPQLYLDKQ